MVPENELPSLDDVIAQVVKDSPHVVATPDVTDKVTHKASNDKPITEVDPVEEEAEKSVEAAPEEEKAAVEEKPKKDPQAARFAALARREREARQLREQAETRAKQIEEKERALQERETRLTTAKKHPLDLLKEHGYSYADATQAMLGDYKPKEPDPVVTKLDERVNPLAAQIEELKKAKEEMASTLQELQRHRVEIAQREVRQAIESTAKDGGFEYVAALGDEAYGLVQDVISEHYKKYKRILNYNDACDRVEKYYQERFDKLASAPKVQSRFAPTDPKKAPTKPVPATKPAKESPKTLTQSLTTSSTRAKTDVDALSKTDALAHLASTLKYLDN